MSLYATTLPSLIAVIAELERQQILYKINENMNYTKSNGSVHPLLSPSMLQRNNKPITAHKLGAVLDAVDSLTQLTMIGMLHPLGDGGFKIVDALKGGEKSSERDSIPPISNLHHRSHPCRR